MITITREELKEIIESVTRDTSYPSRLDLADLIMKAIDERTAYDFDANAKNWSHS